MQLGSLGSRHPSTILGRGIAGLLEVTDVSGRVRWIMGDALDAIILTFKSEARSRFKQHIEIANSEYAREEVA